MLNLTEATVQRAGAADSSSAPDSEAFPPTRQTLPPLRAMTLRPASALLLVVVAVLAAGVKADASGWNPGRATWFDVGPDMSK